MRLVGLTPAVRVWGAAAISVYMVRAIYRERGWELHIDGAGVTQSHGLNDAERMVRD